MIRFMVDDFGGVSLVTGTQDRLNKRAYNAKYRKKNREKLRLCNKEWMRRKRGYYNRHPEEAMEKKIILNPA